MQAIWRGAINFGLISIPVRLFAATEEKSLRFNLLHKEDGGRIRNSRTCTVCGRSDLGKDDLVRAFEYEKGSYVEFEDEELERIQTPTSHSVEVVHFTPAAEIDPIYYQRSYYLAPEELGVKAYSLLRSSLEGSGRVAVCKVTIRDKERLATLRTWREVLVLETMYWPDEIREPAFGPLEWPVTSSEQDQRMARMLIDSMTEEFRPEKFRDRYREALLEAVREKVEGREIVAPPSPEQPPQVIDLTEALKRSLAEVEARKASGQ